MTVSMGFGVALVSLVVAARQSVRQPTAILITMGLSYILLVKKCRLRVAFRFLSGMVGMEIVDFGPLTGPTPPRGGLGKEWPGAPLDLHRFSARQSNSRNIQCGFLNPLVTALEIAYPAGAILLALLTLGLSAC